MLGDLNEYVGRASSLFERLSGAYTLSPAKQSSSRIHAWEQALDPGGRTDAIERRVRHLGVAQSDLSILLGDAVFNLSRELPAWVVSLDRLLSSGFRYCSVDDFLAVCVDSSIADIKACADRSSIRLSDTAVDAIARSLLDRIRLPFEGVLDQNQDVLRPERGISKLIAVCDERNEATLSLLQEYPVVGKLVSKVQATSVAAVKRLLSRLATDSFHVKALVGINPLIDPIELLEVGLSDPHNMGETVAVITFASGVRLLYKPKPEDASVWFQSLLRANATLRDLLHAYPEFVLRPGYAWSTFVEHAPVLSENMELTARNAGRILFALYISNSTDVHFQNVRLSRTVPIVVDCETVQHPSPDLTPFSSSVHEASQHLYWNSILRTMFLPQWMAASDANTIDAGGHNDILSCNNLRSMHAFESGFSEAYQEALSSVGVACGTNRPAWHRYILRPTQFYSDLLDYSLNRKFMRYGLDRSISLEVLGRYHLSSGEMEQPTETLLDLEVKSLERMDIPRLMLRGHDRNLYADGGIVCRNFLVSHRFPLPELSIDDLQAQLKIIRLTVTAHAVHRSRDNPTDDSFQHQVQEIRARVDNIAHRVLAGAIYGSNDRPSWLSIQSVRGTGKFQFRPVDMSLYDGTAGIALFLLWYGRLRHNDLALAASIKAVEKCALFCRQEPERAVRTFGCGGMHGIGALLYALNQLSRISESSLFNDAIIETLRILSRKHWTDRTSTDFVSGTAGLLVVLTNICKFSGAEEAAARCVEHIHERAHALAPWQIAWADPSGRFQTGFAHGTAGIVYALKRWQSWTGDTTMEGLVRSARAFEDAQWSEEYEQWAKYGGSKMREFGYSWCHGVPGMLMGRILADPDCGNLDAAEPIAAFKPTSAATLDQICCGHLGRALIAEDLRRNMSSENHHWLADLRDAELRMFFNSEKGADSYKLLPGLVGRDEHLGLMQGISGIGLGLMAFDDTRIPPFWRLG